MSRSVAVTRPGARPGARYRRAMAPNRAFDFLYDPVYMLSSERDHAQATVQAHLIHDQMRKMPEFKAMFSNLIHYPSYSVQLEEKYPVSPFIDRRWRGRAQHHLEMLQKFDILQAPKIEYEDPEVSGRNRWKYFERPFIPFHKSIPLNVIYAMSKPDLYAHQAMFRDKPDYLISQTVGTQTDYRDGEAQTDPYSPEYVVPSSSIPELLTLATLTWGRGLPATQAEVEVIERAREKRAWEATLPPLNDTAHIAKRRRMMEEMERKEWAFREEEIEELQEVRLELLKALLRKREENHNELNITRLDTHWFILMREKEAKVKRIQHEHIKVPHHQIPFGHYSHYFMVAKPDSSFRPILDLRSVNELTHTTKFKMVSLESIIPLLEPDRGGLWVMQGFAAERPLEGPGRQLWAMLECNNTNAQVHQASDCAGCTTTIRSSLWFCWQLGHNRLLLPSTTKKSCLVFEAHEHFLFDRYPLNRTGLAFLLPPPNRRRKGISELG
ncbi:hypothetical protein JRQ81_002068 [Phrynocephalus forsythii]|uniref:Cilia- and flagella-associated protein 91 n=1 Tax=Phrynocephalus forsythii TaxID=171643 RepID=A0A9Q0XHX9_9SAUR|nr:hypothetical protein JRQ81_002068 [Phrynocephalus forsythii]